MDMSWSKLREMLKDREAWCAAIHGVTKSWTWLSDGTETNRGNRCFLGDQRCVIDQVVTRQKGTSLSSSNQQGTKALAAVHSLCSTLCNSHGLNEAGMASLSFTICKSLLKLTSIDLMVSHISSPVTPFSCCPQSFPASGSFPVSWLFASGAQSTGASASASVPCNEYSAPISFRIHWFDLQSRGFSRQTRLRDCKLCWHPSLVRDPTSDLTAIKKKKKALIKFSGVETRSFSRQKFQSVSLYWQSNKASLFYCMQHSASETWIGTGVRRGWAFRNARVRTHFWEAKEV